MCTHISVLSYLLTLNNRSSYAVIRDSVSLFRFPFLSHVQVFWWRILLVCPFEICIQWFLSILVFLVISVLLIFVLFVLFLVALICISLFFLYSHRVVVSLYAGVYFSLFFLMHTTCLCHIRFAEYIVSSFVINPCHG